MSSADRKRRFLACLSDPSRFQLVTTLSGGPRCVTELAGLVGLSQSCTTRHLQALHREGIVHAERRGKRVMYSLESAEAGKHPVVRWACEAPAPVRRGPRVRAAEVLDELVPTAVRVEPGDEMTDVVMIAHDAPWESVDAPGMIEHSPPADSRETRIAPEVPSDSGRARALADAPAAPPVAARRVQDELDDFLL